MIIINFDQLYLSLKTGVVSVANTSMQDYLSQAKADGQTAITTMKADLQRWAQEVENGALTAEDLGFLLKGETALDEMMALKQAGLAKVEIDKFKDSLINMILGTLANLVKI